MTPNLSNSTRNKIQVLTKFRKEICAKVRFSDISHHLLTSGHFGKDDAYEICRLPVQDQMGECCNRLVTVLESQQISRLVNSRQDHKG